MALVGYAHVSTTDQDLAHQIAVLTALGCQKLFSEKNTGTKKQGVSLSLGVSIICGRGTGWSTRVSIGYHEVCATCKIWCMILKAKT